MNSPCIGPVYVYEWIVIWHLIVIRTHTYMQETHIIWLAGMHTNTQTYTRGRQMLYVCVCMRESRDCFYWMTMKTEDRRSERVRAKYSGIGEHENERDRESKQAVQQNETIPSSRIVGYIQQKKTSNNNNSSKPYFMYSYLHCIYTHRDRSLTRTHTYTTHIATQYTKSRQTSTEHRPNVVRSV